MTMILFDPEQSEAVEGFPGLGAAGDSRAGLPARPTLMRYLREAQGAVGLKGEVSVLLTTDEGIRALNRRFRKKNKATDVLSFPTDDPRFGSAGDLAISVETAARQAREQGHSLRVEVRVLMLHGLLHLAGMDHETDEGKMARKERRLREKLGLPMGLIERVVGDGGLEQQIPLRGMTERKARATAKTTATTKTEADSPKGNDRKKSKGHGRGKTEADSLSGMTERKARAKATAKAKPKTARVRGVGL